MPSTKGGYSQIRANQRSVERSKGFGTVELQVLLAADHQQVFQHPQLAGAVTNLCFGLRQGAVQFGRGGRAALIIHRHLGATDRRRRLEIELAGIQSRQRGQTGARRFQAGDLRLQHAESPRQGARFFARFALEFGKPIFLVGHNRRPLTQSRQRVVGHARVSGGMRQAHLPNLGADPAPGQHHRHHQKTGDNGAPLQRGVPE